MAVLTGTTGDVTITGSDGVTAFIFQWSADVTREIFDASSFDTANNSREKIGGPMQLVGSCQAHCAGTTPTLTDMQTDDFAGTAGFVLSPSTGETWTFKGIISGISMTVEKNGQAIITMNFESTGTIAVASSA